MSTRILITGGTGLLGQALLNSVPPDVELFDQPVVTSASLIGVGQKPSANQSRSRRE